MNFPVAITIKENTDNEENNFYPYYNNNWEDRVRELQMTVPFEIMDRSMGLSTCTRCKQTYSGFQSRCVKLVPKYLGRAILDNHYPQIRTDLGYRPIGEIYSASYYSGSYEVIETIEEACGANCNWDLSSQFYEQKQFFEFVEWISNCPVNYDPSWFAKYRFSFPVETVDLLEKRLMIEKIQTLERHSKMVESALQQIANKMNQAGAALYFG